MALSFCSQVVAIPQIKTVNRCHGCGGDDGCEARTLSESFLTDFSDRTWDRQTTCETFAVIKSTTANGGHAVTNSQVTRETTAVIESPITYRRHRMAYD